MRSFCPPPVPVTDKTSYPGWFCFLECLRHFLNFPANSLPVARTFERVSFVFPTCQPITRGDHLNCGIGGFGGIIEVVDVGGAASNTAANIKNSGARCGGGTGMLSRVASANW